MIDKVVVKKSSIHGRGLFAAGKIVEGEHIGTFEGERTSKNGTHVLWLLDETNDSWYGVIGKNELRYLNHSSEPNAEFNHSGQLYSLCDIESGVEITIDYGDELQE